MKTKESFTLCFSLGRDKFYARPAEIIRLEARSNYTKIFFTNHPPLLMAKVLRLYEEILRPHGFVRTHRSHLVNADFIKDFMDDNIVQMHDASQAGISRRKKRAVFLSIAARITPIGNAM